MTDVLSSLFECVSTLVICFGLYVFLLRRLAQFVQPLRLKMAEHGEAMLGSGISSKESTQVKFYLDNAFHAWPMALFALLFPFFVAVGFVRFSMGKKAPNTSIQMDKMAMMFTISALAANPLFGVFAVIELAVIGGIVLLVSEPTILLRAARSLFRVEAAPWRPHRLRFG